MNEHCSFHSIAIAEISNTFGTFYPIVSFLVTILTTVVVGIIVAGSVDQYNGFRNIVLRVIVAIAAIVGFRFRLNTFIPNHLVHMALVRFVANASGWFAKRFLWTSRFMSERN